MNKLTKHIILFTVSLFSVCLLIMTTGCGSTQLPAQLTAEESAFLNKYKGINAVVGVENYKYPAYSDSLFNALKGADIFTDVKYLNSQDDFEDISYTARVNKRIYGTAVFPFWTIITFGIIPTIVSERHGESFLLTSTETGKQYPIEVIWTGETILGWWGLFDSLLYPNRICFGSPEKTERFYKRLRLEIFKVFERKNRE
jgi:hypothetical protein